MCRGWQLVSEDGSAIQGGILYEQGFILDVSANAELLMAPSEALRLGADMAGVKRSMNG